MRFLLAGFIIIYGHLEWIRSRLQPPDVSVCVDLRRDLEAERLEQQTDVVTANLNPVYLLREWDGLKNARKVIPLGPSSSAVKSLFDDACAVIVFNDGTAETIPAKELTYGRIYRRAFKGPPQLGYLTIRGFVEPKGVDK